MAIELEVIKLAVKINDIEHALLNMRKDIEYLVRKEENDAIVEEK